MLALLLLGILCVGYASVVQLTIHYPQEHTAPLTDGSVFSLYVCYLPGCPYTGYWNQTGPSLTVYTREMISPNTYVKNITLPNYSGKVYLTISASFNLTTYVNSISKCTGLPICNALGTPYVTTLATTKSIGQIVAYPWFGIYSGKVYTILPQFYSPQLNNYRDISVYIPPSLSQNYLSRPINILVLNDGTLSFVQDCTGLGGFDRAVQNGDIPSNTIIVGIPPASACDRPYILTYEACDPTVISCSPGCDTGGMMLYLQFIRENVIPAVLSNLSMSLGEVSMAGYSYGGLAACAAASFQPSYFQRALCMSPSVYWNFGDLVNNISINAQQYGLPKSIVMYIGTDESTFLTYPSVANL